MHAMEIISSTPDAVWLGALLASAVAGFAVGFRRAWWFALLGVIAPMAMAVGSRFVSNDTFSGSEDLSWQIVLLFFVAPTTAVSFFVSLGCGAGLRAITDRLGRGGGRLPEPHG